MNKCENIFLKTMLIISLCPIRPLFYLLTNEKYVCIIEACDKEDTAFMSVFEIL